MLADDGQTVGIRQRELLVGVFFYQSRRLFQFFHTETVDSKGREFLDKCEKLHRSANIISAQKPPMSFRNNQR